MGNLGLPSQPILAVDLDRDLEALGALQQAGSHDNQIVAHDSLMVVRVGGAVRAVVAVNGLSCGRNVSLRTGRVCVVVDCQLEGERKGVVG